MNRKILALILALAAVVIVLAVILCRTPGKDANETTPNIPGIADSIFDTEPVVTQAPVETDAPEETEEPTTSATEHGNTIPTGPADPDAGYQDPGADVPENTRPAQTDPAVTEPDATEPQQPQQTQPTQPNQPAETEPVQVPAGEIDYETFVALEPAVQREYMESFESMDAFFEWYNTAKEAYEQEHPAIDVGDGVIDLEDLFG